MSVLAYIPFLDPMPIHDLWYLLLVPLSFGISVIYKALRVPTFEHFWRRVVVMTTQIVVAMIALAIALNVFVQLVIPALPVGR